MSVRDRRANARAIARLTLNCATESLAALLIVGLFTGRVNFTIGDWAIVTVLALTALEIHELAHASVGVALGGSVRGFVVGAWGAGVVFDAPPPVWSRQRWRPIATIAAGPLAHYAFGLTLVLVSSAAGWSGRVPAADVAGWAAIVSGTLNLMPTKLAGRHLDGHRIALILRSHDDTSLRPS